MKRCLVVDDSSVVRKVARRILEDLQFNVSEAEDGDHALRECAAAMPDIIIVDWNMPVMSGVDFLHALRETEGGEGPTVVFCTSENDVAQIAKAMRAGANNYILKPFDRESVEAKLQEIGFL
mgnify:CR=1 FL=1